MGDEIPDQNRIRVRQDHSGHVWWAEIGPPHRGPYACASTGAEALLLLAAELVRKGYTLDPTAPSLAAGPNVVTLQVYTYSTSREWVASIATPEGVRTFRHWRPEMALAGLALTLIAAKWEGPTDG